MFRFLFLEKKKFFSTSRSSGRLRFFDSCVVTSPEMIIRPESYRVYIYLYTRNTGNVICHVHTLSHMNSEERRKMVSRALTFPPPATADLSNSRHTWKFPGGGSKYRLCGRSRPCLPDELLTFSRASDTSSTGGRNFQSGR